MALRLAHSQGFGCGRFCITRNWVPGTETEQLGAGQVAVAVLPSAEKRSDPCCVCGNDQAAELNLLIYLPRLSFTHNRLGVPSKARQQGMGQCSPLFCAVSST